MDESTKIHRNATRILKKGTDEQLGWAFTYEGYFDYFAEKKDDCIAVYVQWADDQPGDMYGFEEWYEVSRNLQEIISLLETTNKLSGIS